MIYINNETSMSFHCNSCMIIGIFAIFNYLYELFIIIMEFTIYFFQLLYKEGTKSRFIDKRMLSSSTKTLNIIIL